ncbi:hypothetical protein PVV24_23790, partial [Salmonella enterica subsp. enterica serovar Mbandaka]|uniref:hypothetical protein n=1 Tax=Salmonella enterica TaxID=28901 RepID=UPI002FFBD759
LTRLALVNVSFKGLRVGVVAAGFFAGAAFFAGEAFFAAVLAAVLVLVAIVKIDGWVKLTIQWKRRLYSALRASIAKVERRGGVI